MFIEPSYSNIGHRGWIEVIVGPMFSGKTEELIRRIKRAQIARQPVGLFKSPLDKRYSEEAVVSHDQNNIPSVDINKAMDTFQHVGNARVVGFDEAQFFDDQLVDVARQLALYNYRVIVAGLDMDYEGKPFSPMPEMLAVAEYITKVHAICVQCRNLATHSFRKAEADQQIMVGAAEAYEPRCRKCFHDGMADKACE
jgi:thymidine kinase